MRAFFFLSLFYILFFPHHHQPHSFETSDTALQRDRRKKRPFCTLDLHFAHPVHITHTFSTSPPVIWVRSFSNFCPLVYYPSSLFVELSPTTFPPLPIHFPSFLFRPHTRLDPRVALHSHRWTTLKQLSLPTTLLTALIST